MLRLGRNAHLVPRPIKTPLVKNKPPTFSVQKPLRMEPRPRQQTPQSAACLVPTFLMNVAQTRAPMLLKVTHRDPIQDRVEAGASCLSTRAAWTMPQE